MSVRVQQTATQQMQLSPAGIDRQRRLELEERGAEAATAREELCERGPLLHSGTRTTRGSHLLLPGSNGVVPCRKGNRDLVECPDDTFALVSVRPEEQRPERDQVVDELLPLGKRRCRKTPEEKHE